MISTSNYFTWCERYTNHQWHSTDFLGIKPCWSQNIQYPVVSPHPKYQFLYQYLTAKVARLVRQDLPLINPPWLLLVVLFLCSYKRPQRDSHHPRPRNWVDKVDKVVLLVCSSQNPSFALPEDQCDACFLQFFEHLRPYAEQEPIWSGNFGKGVKWTFFLLRGWEEQVFQAACRVWLGISLLTSLILSLPQPHFILTVLYLNTRGNMIFWKLGCY